MQLFSKSIQAHHNQLRDVLRFSIRKFFNILFFQELMKHTTSTILILLARPDQLYNEQTKKLGAWRLVSKLDTKAPNV